MTTKIYISQIDTSLASIGQSIVVGSSGFEFTNLVGYTGSQGPVGAPTTSQLLTGNGSNTEFTLLGTVLSTKNIFVAVNGLIQIPDTDYQVSNTTITFSNIVANTSDIEIRYFELASVSGICTRPLTETNMFLVLTTVCSKVN